VAEVDINQFISRFNEEARLADVEAMAFWDSGSSEVRIAPGTSGWRSRDITGWSGSYFSLAGSTITSGTVFGPGSGGDLRNSQNVFQQNETTAAGSSTIRVTRQDGTLLEESTSTWNRHTLSSIGATIDIMSTAEAGDTSTFYLSASQIQAGPNTGDGDLVYLSIPDIKTDQLGIDNLRLSTICSSERAIGEIDTAMDIINSRRTYFGSTSNKFASVLNNLAEMETNSANSETLIRDTDMAHEAANLAKQKILSNAIFSVAAQANASRKNVLALIRSI